jgi:GT2 family glycosyltransferase
MSRELLWARFLRSARNLYFSFQKWDPRSVIELATPTAAPEASFAEAGESKCDIICFPIIDWDFRFQRPQQLMSQFADAGHRVFYIQQQFLPAGSDNYLVKRKRRNVFEVALSGRNLSVYRDALNERDSEKLFQSLDALRRDYSLGATAMVIQLPFWLPTVKRAHEEWGWPIIYDCMDLHAGFSTNTEEMLDHEKELLAAANVAIVSSGVLQAHALAQGVQPVLIRNACDYEHFAKVRPAKHTPPRPVIGYYGAISDWFDSDIVADLAERRPDWDFVLVGSTYLADTSRLAKLPNVSLPGEKPYAEIPEWLAKFDVAIIPFKRMPLTEATNPVKAYEMLAAGKPIVSVPIPEMRELASLVYLASDAGEFESAITAALAEKNPAIEKKRRAFAKEHTWKSRYEVLAPAVHAAFPKLSIVIVTYNNLELNKLCLESVYARTEWPNFEVFVVDNGSTDGTASYLKKAKKKFPNLLATLNEHNRGFATGNNIGIARANGEFLILLNNDTVVTRGWASTLIRHLHENPALGMVGPVTNAIGNEAKIEVGYTDLADMPAWARQYTRDHDGELFGIGLLAMFCVAMRMDVFRQVGPLDERFRVGMFEDDDYACRVRLAGYEILCCRDSFVHHWQRAAFRLLSHSDYVDIFAENRRRYEAKWGVPWFRPDHQRPDDIIKIQALRGNQNRPAEYIDFATLQKEIKDAQLRKQLVFVHFSPVFWDEILHQRPHHIVEALAQKGTFTIFIDPEPFVRPRSDEPATYRRITPNLTVVHDRNVLDWIEGATISIYSTQTVLMPSDIARLRERNSILYEYIDEVDVAISGASTPRLTGVRNAMLSGGADIVVVSAAELEQEVRASHFPPANIVSVPNGVRTQDFQGLDAWRSRPPQAIREFIPQYRAIVGYYGAIAPWLWFELIDQLAVQHPDLGYLYIGPRYAELKEVPPDRPNILWVGPVGYSVLPFYAMHFDVAIIPFHLGRIAKTTSPLKLFEYFALGKPTVVTSDMAECLRFPEVFHAADGTSFGEAIAKALEAGKDRDYVQRLLRRADENTWDRRAEVLRSAIQSTSK